MTWYNIWYAYFNETLTSKSKWFGIIYSRTKEIASAFFQFCDVPMYYWWWCLTNNGTPLYYIPLYYVLHHIESINLRGGYNNTSTLKVIYRLNLIVYAKFDHEIIIAPMKRLILI